MDGPYCNAFGFSMQKYILLQTFMDLSVICGILEQFKINFQFSSILGPFSPKFGSMQHSDDLYPDEIGFNMWKRTIEEKIVIPYAIYGMLEDFMCQIFIFLSILAFLG